MTKPRTTKSGSVRKCPAVQGMEALRLEYVHGIESTEALAQKHCITHASVEKVCTRQSWAAERKAFRAKVRAEVEAESIEENVRRAKESSEEEYKLVKFGRGKVAQSFKALSEAPEGAELRDIFSALEKAQKIVRLALGLSTEHQQISGTSVIELVWPTKAKTSDGE